MRLDKTHYLMHYLMYIINDIVAVGAGPVNVLDLSNCLTCLFIYLFIYLFI